LDIALVDLLGARYAAAWGSALRAALKKSEGGLIRSPGAHLCAQWHSSLLETRALEVGPAIF
jgi:hypothetical protein